MRSMVGDGRRIRIAAFGALALLAAGCSGSSTETTIASQPTTAPPTSVATTSPPTTAATTTTQAPTTTVTTTTADPLARPEKLVSNFDRDSVDDFDTTGDNLWRVMLEIADLFNYLEGHPIGTGEEMLSQTYLPSHGSWEGLLGGFNELAENQWRYVDAGTQTVAIEVKEVDEDRAVVRWASQRGDQLIANRAGDVVKTYSGWDLDILTYVLLRADDGRWRIAETIEVQRPVPPQALDDMVPVEWQGREQ